MTTYRVHRSTAALLALVVSWSACSNDGDPAAGSDDETVNAVGDLTPIVGQHGQLRPDDPILSDPAEGPGLAQVDIRGLSDFEVTRDGDIWALICCTTLAKLNIDETESHTFDRDEVYGTGDSLGVNADGVVAVVSRGGEVLRPDGDVLTPTGYDSPPGPGAGDGGVFDPAVADDGTIFVEDATQERIVAVGPDNSVRTVLDNVTVVGMAPAEDGTLYFQGIFAAEGSPTDAENALWMIPVGGTTTRLNAGQEGDAPTPGANAAETSIGGGELAVGDLGLYVLRRNEIWRIDEDGRLHLVFQRPWEEPPPRGENPNEIDLTELAVRGDDVYAYDQVEGIIYRVEPGEPDDESGE